jgi:ubiquinone/menaquinone biosynthesis C-methylase UbiE
MSSETIIGHHEDKYASRNPIARLLVDNFLTAVTSLYILARPAGKQVLEVGCGEGKLANHLLAHAPTPARFLATDLDLAHLTPELDPHIETAQASAYALPYPDRSFDIVVCCEVLEHLDDPLQGLSECARVAREGVLISTPWEPVWRALNVARLKYLRELGNTPGHVQHFSRGGLEQLAARRLRVLAMRKPLPWTAILGEPLGGRAEHR